MPIPLLSAIGRYRARESGSHRVLGHDIPKPRLTAAGMAYLLAYLAIPVVIAGNLLDFAVQWLFGWCVGVWCIFAS